MWTLTRGQRWTWEAWVAGCCHPSLASRFGYSRVTNVRSQQIVRGGASISCPPQCALPSSLMPGTISCLVWSTEQTPVCVGGSFLFGWPLSSSGCRMRWRSCLRLGLKIIKQNRGMHNGVSPIHAGKRELGSIFVSCRDHPWIPCGMCRCEGWDKHTVTPQRRRAFLKRKFGAEKQINQGNSKERL